MKETLTPNEAVEECSPAAADLIDRLRGSSVPVDLEDQIKAASADDGLIRHLAATIPGKSGERIPTREESVLSTALVIYATAVCAKRMCRHLDRRSGPRPVVASMAVRSLSCPECLTGMIARYGDRCPGGCDWCHEPTGFFYPVVLKQGVITLHSDACERCSKQVAEALPI